MQRTPWALVTASLWVTTLQGARAEPSSAKPPAPQAAAPTTPTMQLPAAVPTAQSALRRLDPSAPTWRAYLAALPELRLYAPSFTPFGAAATDDALARGKRSRANIKAWQFVDGPFEWTLAGQVLWIVSGKTERGALLSVLAPGSAGPQHRASTVIAEPEAVIAIGLSTERPNELLWTTCYGCPGQSGSIELAADGRPMFVYR